MAYAPVTSKNLMLVNASSFPYKMQKASFISKVILNYYGRSNGRMKGKAFGCVCKCM